MDGVGMNWYKLSQYEYRTVGPEDDEYDEGNEGADNQDLYGQGEDIFVGSPVRPKRDSRVKDVVMSDGVVIGATSEEWVMYDKEAFFSFDIVIQPEHRGKKIGSQLIERAIQRYENEKYDFEDMGKEVEMKLEAINLPLADFLIREFGFTVEKRLPDRVFLKRK